MSRSIRPTFQMNTTTTDNQAEQTEKRIRIAEACGWKITQISVNEPNDDVSITPTGLELNPWRDVNVELPDYFNDLNAMADAEKTLDAAQRKVFVRVLNEGYGAEGSGLEDIFFLVNATAAQRAEAFLLTIAP